MPKVSVIIPCFNLGQYLDEAVDSVLEQTFQDFEIIIVNDGSTDEFTNKLLANYNKPKTRVLTTENQGLPSARNNGIKISSGEYITCLDADDKFHPEFLEKTVAVLQADLNRKIGFVAPWVQIFGEENYVWETGEFNPYKLAIENQMTAPCLFRRECWEKKGGYSTNLSGYQDWDFWISIVALGYKWVCIKEPLILYRSRPDSMLKGSSKKKIQLFRQIIRNNNSFYESNHAEILVQSLELMDVMIDAWQQRGLWIEHLEKELESKNKELESKNKELDSKSKELDNNYKKLAEKEQQIQDLLNSYSWKITAPLRAIFRHHE